MKIIALLAFTSIGAWAASAPSQAITYQQASTLVQQLLKSVNTSADKSCNVTITPLSTGGISVGIDHPNIDEGPGGFDNVNFGDTGVKILTLESIQDGNRLHLESEVQYPGGGDLGPPSKGTQLLIIKKDGTVQIKNNKDQIETCKIQL